MKDTYEFKKVLDLQPREKAICYGITVLSDWELLKVLVGSGNKIRSVGDIAHDLMKLVDNSQDFPRLEELMAIKGMGIARATLMAAALEFTRRVYLPSNKKINSPADAYPLLAHMADRQQEFFFTLSLNGAHEHIKTRQVSQGLLNRAIVHPREVFAGALEDRAAAILVAHNHPSGSLEPSGEDYSVTERLKKAGEILGVPLLDHLIITPRGYYSFMEKGYL